MHHLSIVTLTMSRHQRRCDDGNDDDDFDNDDDGDDDDDNDDQMGEVIQPMDANG